jgi:hypothetical protein
MLKQQHFPEASSQWLSNYLHRKKLQELKGELEGRRNKVLFLRRAGEKTLRG